MPSTFHGSNATSIVACKKYAFPSLAPLFFFFHGLVVFLTLRCRSCLYVLEMNFWQVSLFENDPPPHNFKDFSFLEDVLAVERLLRLIRSCFRFGFSFHSSK